MNLVEHYIKKVYSTKDVTDDYNNHTNDVAIESLLEVDIEYNCYGRTERSIKRFWKSEWDTISKRGYFFG